jgi:hypothetical protein
MEVKTCSKCKEVKAFSEFWKNKRNKNGLHSECNECMKERNKGYIKKLKDNGIYTQTKREEYDRNRDKYLSYQKSYKDRRRVIRKMHYDKNKKNINEKRRLKTNNNPLLKLKENLRSRTRIAFKRKGWRKESKNEEMLGASIKLAKAHIERQFTKGMNWSNQGEWHIDHIIPLASANTEEEIIKLCHYTNLQPLWAKDNLEKSDKIIETQMKLRI